MSKRFNHVPCASIYYPMSYHLRSLDIILAFNYTKKLKFCKQLKISYQRISLAYLCFGMVLCYFSNSPSSSPVWLWKQSISALSGPVLTVSHTEKSCIASYYRQFSTNINIQILELIPVLLARACSSSVLKKLI